MKIKLLILFLLLFSISGFSQKWVQFTKDKDIVDNLEHVFNDKNFNKNNFPIKIFKGEIFKNIEQEGDIDFIVYGHLRNELRCGSGYKQSGITLGNKALHDSILKYKQTFLKRKKGKKTNGYRVNISKLRELGITDTIRFINGSKLTVPFVSRDSATRNEGISNIARLIIPGYPSLFFNKDNLPEYEDTPAVPSIPLKKYEIIDLIIENTKSYLLVRTEDEAEIYKLIFNNELKEKDLNKIPVENKTLINKSFTGKKNGFWHYHKWIKENGKWVDKEGFNYIKLLWFLPILLPVVFYKFILKRFGNPIRVEYDGGSFEQFAQDNDTTVKKLITYNKTVLKEYQGGERHDTGINSEVLEDIKEKIIVRYSFFNRDKNTVEKPLQVNNSSSNLSTDETSLKAFLANQFADQLDDIKEAIKNSSNKPIQSQQEIEKLTSKVKDKDREIEELGIDILEKEKEIEIKKEKVEERESQINKLTEKYQGLDNKLKQYSEKLLLTPYLEDLGKNYLKLLETIGQSIQTVQNSIVSSKNELTTDEISTLFVLTNTYPTSFNTGYWKYVFENLSKGFLSEPQLIQKLNDFQGDTDKIEFFKKYTYDNIWEPYSNKVLLYLENVRVIANFTNVGTNATHKLQKVTQEAIETTRLQLKSCANLDVNYVSLLENYEDFLFAKLDNNTPTDLHKQFKVRSEDIIQIISFGFAENHGFENKDTWVIVK